MLFRSVCNCDSAAGYISDWHRGHCHRPCYGLSRSALHWIYPVSVCIQLVGIYLYSVSVDCVGFDPSEEVGVTTRTAGVGTTNFAFTRKPSAILTLGSINSLTMSCTDVEAACGSNCTVTDTVADTCGSGCTVTLALSRNRTYDCHHEWGTDGSTWIHVGPSVPYTVK